LSFFITTTLGELISLCSSDLKKQIPTNIQAVFGQSLEVLFWLKMVSASWTWYQPTFLFIMSRTLFGKRKDEALL
jgi:hypothetical protein